MFEIKPFGTVKSSKVGKFYWGFNRESLFYGTDMYLDYFQ